MYEDEASRTMPVIADDVVLKRGEYILGSGTGTLDFAVAGGSEYYTWYGIEDADWYMTGVERIENDDEDQLLIYPSGDYSRCEIAADK